MKKSNVFTPALTVSFRTARALRTHLVKAKVYPAKSKKCLRDYCQVHKNVVETESFCGQKGLSDSSQIYML